MALISFDYGELNEASKIAKSVSGHFGAYNDYRNDLKRDLHSSLDEWKLAASEPNGCTSVSDARSNITTKRMNGRICQVILFLLENQLNKRIRMPQKHLKIHLRHIQITKE